MVFDVMDRRTISPDDETSNCRITLGLYTYTDDVDITIHNYRNGMQTTQLVHVQSLTVTLQLASGGRFLTDRDGRMSLTLPLHSDCVCVCLTQCECDTVSSFTSHFRLGLAGNTRCGHSLTGRSSTYR